jgi:methyl-accepting chemotaxis protein
MQAASPVFHSSFFALKMVGAVGLRPGDNQTVVIENPSGADVRPPSIAFVETLASGLERQFQGLEHDFLSLGERLCQFRNRSNTIAEKASAVTSLMAGAELSAAIDTLGRYQEKIGASDSGTCESVDALFGILEKFKEIRSPLQSLVKIVKYLDVICVIMKIENARFVDTETGFATVAKGLKDIGVVIRGKSEDLGNRSESITAEIVKALQSVRRNEQLQNQNSKVMLGCILDSLDPLQNKRKASASALNELSSLCQSITRSVSTIVASLQFHDITRQRIEHSSNALREIKNCSPHEKQLHWEKQLADAAGICRLQAAQLSQAREDLSGAVHSLKESLSSLSQEIGQILGETRKIAGASGESGESFLGEIKKGLASLRDDSAEYLRLKKEISTAIASVAGAVEEISSFAREIKEIGTGMRIMAMNASVNASRIGDEGRSLGVLAKEIQDLASETVIQIEKVADALKIMIASAQNLSNDDEKASVDRMAGISRLNAEIEALDANLQGIDSQTSLALQEIESLGALLSKDVDAAIAEFKSPDAFMHAIENACASLEEFVEQAHACLPQEYIELGSSMVNELAARYTMNRERNIHESLMKSGKSASPAIGSNKARSIALATVSDKQSEIGENVEFF